MAILCQCLPVFGCPSLPPTPALIMMTACMFRTLDLASNQLSGTLGNGICKVSSLQYVTAVRCFGVNLKALQLGCAHPSPLQPSCLQKRVLEQQPLHGNYPRVLGRDAILDAVRLSPLLYSLRSLSCPPLWLPVCLVTKSCYSHPFAQERLFGRQRLHRLYSSEDHQTGVLEVRSRYRGPPTAATGNKITSMPNLATYRDSHRDWQSRVTVGHSCRCRVRITSESFSG